jgi:hypothetical protein
VQRAPVNESLPWPAHQVFADELHDMDDVLRRMR